MEENNYYPFGLKHENYNVTQQGYMEGSGGAVIVGTPRFDENYLGYSYRYNGKEFQEELNLNWYDYGARNYDPAIGRWLVPDALSEANQKVNSYNYVSDNPINNIDIGGHIEIPSKSDQTKYSKLTNYLKNGIGEILSNPNIMAALAKYGGFSESQVKNLITTFGKGIKLEFYNRESIVYGPNGFYGDKFGSSYQKGLPIHIARDLAQTLEDSETGSFEEQIAYLSVLVTILHESTHYGDINLKPHMDDGIDVTRYDAKGYRYLIGEIGKLFEIDAFWDGNTGRWLKGKSAESRFQEMQELLSNKNCNGTLNSLPQGVQNWLQNALKINPNIKIFIY